MVPRFPCFVVRLSKGQRLRFKPREGALSPFFPPSSGGRGSISQGRSAALRLYTAAVAPLRTPPSPAHSRIYRIWRVHHFKSVARPQWTLFHTSAARSFGSAPEPSTALGREFIIRALPSVVGYPLLQELPFLFAFGRSGPVGIPGIHRPLPLWL